MHKFLILSFLFLCFANGSMAQTITKPNLKALQKKEDSLNILSWRISNEFKTSDRLRADSFFTRIFVRALAINNSFKYPFDSVQIAKLTAPDTAFKLFTWQVETGKNKLRQRGVIQYNTPDGKLIITPLIDNSEYSNDLNAINDNRNWIGAIYYKILLNNHYGKKYYTLIGYDDNNTESNKKWIDVISFNEPYKPQFGAAIFNHTTKGLLNRIGIEYKKDSKIKVNYDEEQQMIIYDHLTSESGFVNKRSTYVADGDYEGLKWNNGQWQHQEKVMCNCPLSTKENKDKVNESLFDNAGQKNENKLQEKSKNNEVKQVIPKKSGF